MIRQSSLGGTAATFLLLLAVALAPLPFGSVLVRERAALQLCLFLALAAALLGRRRRPLFGAAAAPAAALAAVALFGVFQSLPLPRTVTAAVSPWIVASWDGAGALLGRDFAAVPLSVAPAVSRTTALQWLAVAACLAAAGLLGHRRWSRLLLLGAIVAAAVFEVVYGADKWFAGSEEMWGIEVAGDPGRLRGTFINPDHAAFYLMLAATVVAAWLWWGARRVLGEGTFERRMLVLVAPLLLFLLLFVGDAFTGSRGGLLALVAALAFQGALLTLRYRRWQVAAGALAALLVGLGGVVFFGLQAGLGRWLETSAYEVVSWSARLAAYAASWDLWLLSPWTGTGLGTFRQAFPTVQPAALDSTWVHAHSDVLEMLVTTGVVGPPLLVWGAVALYRRLFAVFARGRRSEERALALAALGAVTGALVHSAVDFALTIPANAVTLAAICGLACGAELRPDSASGAPVAGAPGAVQSPGAARAEGTQRKR